MGVRYGSGDKESFSEDKVREYPRNNKGPRISFLGGVQWLLLFIYKWNGSLCFSCNLGVRTDSDRLHSSGLWHWVLLCTPLLDSLQKTWQIVSCSDADGGRDFGVSPFPEPPASCSE